MNYLFQLLVIAHLIVLNVAVNNDPDWCSDYAGYCAYVEFSSQCPIQCNRADVNGMWATWSSWGTCNKDCNGVKEKTRYCSNPLPKGNGLLCLSDISYLRLSVETLTTSCNTNTPACRVAVNGGWGTWENWSDCSVSCGDGQRFRTRSCNSPPPSNDGLFCMKENEERGMEETDNTGCNFPTCSVDGGYTEWSSYTTCSKSCGGGVHYKKRCCTNPTPQNNGHGCSGVSVVSQSCSTNTCPVDGAWTTWMGYLGCTATCGFTGTKPRGRTCTSPAPSNGGATCLGNKDEVAVCNRKHCPIDGAYSEWAEWSQCTTSCEGVKYRTRCCDSPAPQHNGNTCSDPPAELSTCHNNGQCASIPECPVDADIGYILDSSISAAQNFVAEKTFLKELAKAFPLTTSGSHASIIQFASTRQMVFKFSDTLNQDDFNTAVDALTVLESTVSAANTRIDAALFLAKEEMFLTSNGGRANAPKLVILLTDGDQSSAPGSGNPVDIADELRAEGKKVLAIGIGTSATKSELRNISGGDYNWIRAEAWEELTNSKFQKATMKLACQILTDGDVLVGN